MPKFVTIGYGDEAGYNQTSPEVRDAAHAHDASLVQAGALVGRAGGPVQVRNPGGKGLQTNNGAFMASPLPIAGFAIIEAADIQEAIRLVAETPCAVASGVVEVWPLLGS
ncbi:MAG TPA: YciI family protein [Sphingomonas sp.]|nr:YciI family protein [Sphingomonas sp.]